MIDRRATPTTPAPRWGLGDAALGVLAALVGSTILAGLVVGSDADPTLAERFVVNIPLWVALVAVPVWATRTKGRGPVVDLGLRFAPVDVLIGLVAGTILQLGVVNGAYWLLRDVWSRDEVEGPARELTDTASGATWVLLAVMVLVLAPVVEELFYRGLVLRALDRTLPTWVAVATSAAAFALMHFQGVQLVGLFLFGLATAALVQWTGRLGTSMVTHLVFNAWALWQVRGR